MKRVILLILLFSSLLVQGQVSFQFIPDLHGRSVDGLFQVGVINSTGSVVTNARLVMRVTAKASTGDCCSFTSASVSWYCRPAIDGSMGCHTKVGDL